MYVCMERERESHFSKSIFHKDISFFLCFVTTLNELKNNLQSLNFLYLSLP